MIRAETSVNGDAIRAEMTNANWSARWLAVHKNC